MNAEVNLKIAVRFFAVMGVAALISGASPLVASIISVSGGPGGSDGGTAQAACQADEQVGAQPPARAENGEREGGAGAAAGLEGVLVTPEKLGGITAVIVHLQKKITILANRPKSRQASGSAS